MSPPGHDIARHPQAVRVRKRPVQAHVSFAREAGSLQTLEGPVRYAAGAALVTGVTGERWPVEREWFDQAYVPCAGVQHGDDGLYQRRPIEVLALRLTAPTSVRVGPSGDVLHGKAGDWLLQYGPDRHGIVEAGVFAATYEGLSDEPLVPAAPTCATGAP